MPDFAIKNVFAREVLDSRGNPTVEVEIHTATHRATAIVPSGASTGVHEALELRDGDFRYHGKGVLGAVRNVAKIGQHIVGLDVRKQKEIDELMIKLDGTQNKSALGANAILGVSMCAARLAAMAQDKQLYHYLAELAATTPKLVCPFANVINGGQHADNELKIQEFMIVPIGIEKFKERMRAVSEVYHTLKGLLLKLYGKSATNVGDEGGFAPMIKSAEDALELLQRAIKESGYQGRLRLAIDAAASYFYNGESYVLEQSLTREQLVGYWVKLVSIYDIYSLEDPFAEDDFEGFRMLTERLGDKLQIIGDDLLVTNPERLKIAIQKRACNSLLLKLNQIGTLTEAIQAAKLAYSAGWKVMVSHRSGETEDTFIADLAVALGCGQIKLGAPCRSERTAKYNRLLRIAEQFNE